MILYRTPTGRPSLATRAVRALRGLARCPHGSPGCNGRSCPSCIDDRPIDPRAWWVGLAAILAWLAVGVLLGASIAQAGL